MVMMLVILSTAIGTVTGVIATILLMQRKGQYLATGADLTARRQLPETERALANATATVEELRKQLAAQGQILQQNREELEKSQQELDAELSQRSTAEQQLGPLTERVRELTAQLEDERRQKDELASWNVTLTAQAGQQSGAVAEQLREAEGKAVAERQSLAAELDRLKQERDTLAGQLQEVQAKSAEERQAVSTDIGKVRSENEELTRKLTELEAKAVAERQSQAAELDALKRENEALAGQVRDLQAKSAEERQAVSTDVDGVRSEKESLARQLRELEVKAAQERLAVWAELDGVRRENEVLAGQLRDLKVAAAAELETERSLKEDWVQRHTALSAEFGQQTASLAAQLRALEAKSAEDRLQFATELDTERQRKEALEAEVERERTSAAEGMELLSLAHKKFSGVFEMRFSEGRNGHANGHHSGVGSSHGENVPVPALGLAAGEDDVFAFASGDARAVSEVAGD